MKEVELIGKTIKAIQRKEVKGKDDDAWLELSFTDGTKILIVASFGGYTGESIDEYPVYVYLSDDYEDLTDK